MIKSMNELFWLAENEQTIIGMFIGGKLVDQIETLNGYKCIDNIDGEGGYVELDENNCIVDYMYYGM